MDGDCETFQLVSNRRRRNRCQTKMKQKWPTINNCIESDGELNPSQLQRLMASVENCRVELDQSVFKEEFKAAAVKAGILVPDVENTVADYPHISKIVCYGVGNYRSCAISRYQFAFLSVLCQLLKIEKKDCFLYDPMFSNLEKAGILTSGYQLIDVNEEGKRLSKELTLYYMPHCGKALYNNLLWANWDPVHLKNTVIIGNSFTFMSESSLNSEFKNLHCISRVMPLMTELSIPNAFVHNDIFNNTSLHVFHTEDIDQQKTLKNKDLFWSKPEEPQYADIEIITAQMRTIQLTQ